MCFTTCFTEENLIYILYVGRPENQLRKHQVTCGPSVLAQGGFTAGSEASVQQTYNICSTMRWLQHSTVTPSRSTGCIAVVHPLSQHPTNRARRSKVPQPAARKQIVYHPHDPCHPTAWKKTNRSKHMAVLSN